MEESLLASMAQPCDQIMGAVRASKDCNSQQNLAKTARKETDHQIIDLQSKINQGHD